MIERLAQWWCRLAHPAPMRPVCGRYRCPRCLRTYPVPWEQPAVQLVPARVRPAARRATA
jgi:hypothetical protein